MPQAAAQEIGHFIKAAGPDGKGPQYYEMTEQDIADTVRGFADASRRAQQAGFDGVELHAGHGYLIASFLSPYTNRRNDQYGGSRENRARFLVEIIEACIEATGGDFPIMIRLDAKEYRIEGGIELEDCLETVRLAEKAGAPELSMSGKKLEMPAYDPRGMQGQGLLYATSNRGACHMRGNMLGPEVLALPRLIDRFGCCTTRLGLPLLDFLLQSGQLGLQRLDLLFIGGHLCRFSI